MAHSSPLVEVTRARQLESRHYGAVAIARADGQPLGMIGDCARSVFPRSAVKIIQALPLIESGAADKFGFTPEELAFACASHSGEPYHADMAAALLQRIGLEGNALACGAHRPLGEQAWLDFALAGHTALRVHNNCSGKHVGMLATALHLGEPIEDYELAHHAVQRRIRAIMQDLCGADLEHVVPGIDGCSVPNWPVPLDRLATAFARIVTGEGFESSRAQAFGRLTEACWAAPRAMAGEGRFDTKVLQRFPGDVFVKVGAEGVYCGGIRSQGIGFALKIDDGAQRAAEMAAGAIIARFVEGAEDLGEPRILENAAGISVGDVRPGEALTSVLSRI